MTKSVEVGVHQAKTHLSELLQRVERGEEVVICRRGAAVARLVPVDAGERSFGIDRGRFTVPDDFDAPLPGDIRGSFEH